MNATLDIFALVLIHVTLVALGGFLVYGLIPRLASTVRAAVASAVAIAVFAVTIGVFLPWPETFRWKSIGEKHVVGVHASQAETGIIQPRIGAAQAKTRKRSPPSPPALYDVIGAFYEGLKPGLGERSDSAQQWIRAITLGILLISAVLVGQLCMGCGAVITLRRRSQRIHDLRLLEPLAAMRTALGCKPVEVRETGELTSAATVGWFCPTILLPRAWPSWTTSELRVVLAHELAHVVRRDFPMRFLGSLCAAIHFYHPLVRSLMRRLREQQEFAADALAVPVIGDRHLYLRSLARLAIRQDRTTAQSKHNTLAVFSSHLTRRVEMLRAMDGSTRATCAWKKRCSVLAIAVVALCVAGLRAPAGRTSDSREAPQASDAKKSSNSPDGTALSGAELRPPATATFGRERFDPSVIPFSESGAFMFRIGAFTESMMMDFYKDWNGWWKTVPTTAKAPIQLDDVEVVGGNVFADNRHGRFRVGSSVLLIRFKTENNWLALFKKYLPTSDETIEPNGTYLTLPNFPAMGPGRPVARQFDGRTILIGADERGAEWVKKNQQFVPQAYHWLPQWKAVDRGVYGLLLNNGPLDWSQHDPSPKLLPDVHAILQHTRYFAIGADAAPGTDMWQFCVRFTGRHDGSVGQLDQSLARLIFAGQVALEEGDFKVPGERVELGKDFLKSIVATPYVGTDRDYLHLTASVKNEAVAPFLFMTPFAEERVPEVASAK